MIAFDDAALADLERFYSFEEAAGDERALEVFRRIRSGVMVLEEHPRMGRPVRGSTLRELVIFVRKTGYVVLYEYDEPADLVRVVAIRHQLEAGYRGR
jgi:plasmid stabilization system protein ParE